jgi:tRNA(fMet)-specific endonuclease VapC
MKTINLNTVITEEYAKIKSSLRKSGNLIDDFDILIGSTAIINNLILVTNNQQHFNRIDNLLTENWK